MRISSMRPGEVLAVEGIAADRERARGRGDRARLRRGAGEVAVDVEAEGGAVVGGCQVRPGVDSEGGRTVGLGIAAADDRAAGRSTRLVRSRLEVVVVVALLDHVAPLVGDRRGPDPRLERHRGAEVQGGGVGDRDAGAGAIEAERLPVLARASTRWCWRPCPCCRFPKRPRPSFPTPRRTHTPPPDQACSSSRSGSRREHRARPQRPRGRALPQFSGQGPPERGGPPAVSDSLALPVWRSGCENTE